MILLGLAVMILFFFWPVILVGGIIFLAWMFWPEKKWQCLGCNKKFHKEKSCKEHTQFCEENRRREEEIRQREENINIISINDTKHQVLLGPYSNINTLQLAYNSINNLDFENIELIRND